MPITPHGLLGRLFHKGVLARWQAATAAAGKTRRTILRAQRYQARQLKSVLQEFCHTADDRLALPHSGSTTFAKPVGTDWSWRPTLWRLRSDQPGHAPVFDKTQFGDEIGIFHDCPMSEITVRQVRNQRDTDIAPFGITMEVFHFGGSYLSVVVDLPVDACANLRKQHLIQLSALIEKDRPAKIFARLNIKNGPNTAQITKTLPDDIDASDVVDFDLAYTELNEKRAERMWVDLIFDTPTMNKITLRDLTFSRYPRAQI